MQLKAADEGQDVCLCMSDAVGCCSVSGDYPLCQSWPLPSPECHGHHGHFFEPW